MEIYRFKNRVEYIKALDKILPDKFVQGRDIGNGKTHCYYPIGIKEAVADDIFLEWNVNDEKYNELRGMLICTIKLNYTPSYPGAEELFCTGSAAVLIQDKKNALEYQLPAVESEAVGRALGKLGNIFGRNLSRKLNKNVALPPDYTIRKHEIASDENHTIEPDPIEKVEPEKPVEKVKPKIELPF